MMCGSAGVVGEAVLLDGLAVAAAAAFLFQHLAIAVQMRRDGEARQAAAQNANRHPQFLPLVSGLST